MENQDYVFNLNDTPKVTFDPKELINMMKQQKILPVDSIKSVSHSFDVSPYLSNGIVPPPKYAEGIWSQINQTTYSPTRTVIERLESLELANRLLKLEILVLKGKFTEEEANNIKAMLTSNDEASITVAETILENS